MVGGLLPVPSSSPVYQETPNRKQPTKLFSIRLTNEERRALEVQAGRQSLSDYARSRLLDNDARARKVQLPTISEQRLAQLLAEFGRSDIAPALRDVAQAARVGILPVAEETDQVIQTACAAVMEIRNTLVELLGLIEGDKT